MIYLSNDLSELIIKNRKIINKEKYLLEADTMKLDKAKQEALKDREFFKEFK
jgi:hypothetical protein